MKQPSMTKIRRLAARASRRYGIKYTVLMGLMEQESSFQIDAISSAGAFGLTQFIPSTAASYGVKPGNAKSQIFGAAKYLKDLGGATNIRQALGNYYGDPSSSYAGEVLAKARKYRGERPLQGLPGIPGALGGTQGPRTATVPTAKYVPPPPPLQELANVLAPQVPGASSPMAAAPSPGDSLSSQLQAPTEGARTSIDPGDLAPYHGRIEKGTRTVELPGVPGLPAGATGELGRVIIAPGADRSGVGTSKPVKQFVREIAGLYGKPLTVTTGTNHSKYTVDGNVSDHWSGNAVDIAASGKKLLRIGRLALIAAGMSRRKAKKIRGGLFNIGGHQIIFNTMEGGNHYDHLHVSV